jgi:hypothetical protein
LLPISLVNEGRFEVVVGPVVFWLKSSLFCLFLKLVQINFIFTDNVRILYIYLTYNDRLTCTIGSAFFRISIPASQLEWMSFPKFKKNHFLHYVHCTCMYILQEIFFLTLYDPRSDSLQMTAYYKQCTYIVFILQCQKSRKTCQI